MLTFSSRLVLAVLLTGPLRAATISGIVRVDSQRTHSPSDVVVWLEPASPAPPSGPAERARLLQKDKTFRPHVLIVKTGTVIDFPNEDPIFHNAFSTYNGQIFDVGLYPPGTNRSVRFRRPGVVRVFCNIHPSMSAVIVVVDTPYFTRTSEKGEYHLSRVPKGLYRVNVYDERATGTPPGQPPVDVETDSGTVAVPVIRISEAGYIQAPHKNKYGLDYPPGSDSPGYEGVMK